MLITSSISFVLKICKALVFTVESLNPLSLKIILVLAGSSSSLYATIPSTTSLVNETYGKDSAYFMGISSMVTALGGFASNMVFGYFNDLLGVRTTFNMVAVCLLLSALVFTLAYKEYHQNPEDNKYLTNRKKKD